MRMFLVVLFFCVGVFAQDTSKFTKNSHKKDLSVLLNKTKVSNGIGLSKLRIDLEHMGLNQYANNSYSLNYVHHISAFMGEVSVFDVVLSPYMSSKIPGGIQFKFKDMNNTNDIELKILDNKGNSIKETFEVKRHELTSYNEKRSKQKNETPIKISSNAMNASTVEEAIIALYGSKTLESTKTLFTNNTEYSALGKMCLSKDCYVDTIFPVVVAIESKIDLRSIAILSTTTPKPLLAFIQVPNNEIVYVKIPFKLENSGKLFFIGEGKDGKLYRSKAHEITAIVRDESNTFNTMYFYLDTESGE